jgi:methionine synthase I (cobalamin-dependent)
MGRGVRGLRSNASKRSHQELNDAAELDDGDPLELGEQHRQIIRDHPHITVLGGCCGTDHRHVACISLAASPG